MTAAQYIGQMAYATKIEDAITEAVASYERHHGELPAVILLHPLETMTEYRGIPIVTAKYIRPGHALAGIEAVLE